MGTANLAILRNTPHGQSPKQTEPTKPTK